MHFWPRQHLTMPITRMGNEVNAQWVKREMRTGEGSEGIGDKQRECLLDFHLNLTSFLGTPFYNM